MLNISYNERKYLINKILNLSECVFSRVYKVYGVECLKLVLYAMSCLGHKVKKSLRCSRYVL